MAGLQGAGGVQEGIGPMARGASCHLLISAINAPSLPAAPREAPPLRRSRAHRLSDLYPLV